MIVLPIWAPHWLCPSLWDGAAGASIVSVQRPLSPAWHSVSQSQLWSQQSAGVTACARCSNILPYRGFGHLTPLP